MIELKEVDAVNNPTQINLNKLTNESLYVWFRDSGNFINDKEFELCTDNYTHQDVLRTVHHLKCRFQLKTAVKARIEKKYWRIRFKASEILKFISSETIRQNLEISMI